MNNKIDELLLQVLEEKIEEYQFYLNLLRNKMQQLIIKQSVVEERLEEYRNFLDSLK